MFSPKIRSSGSLGVQPAARPGLPDVPARAYALYAHCFTCSKDARAPTDIARALTERRDALLRFDFAGLAGSEGEFENTEFSSNVADLRTAAAGDIADHLLARRGRAATSRR